MAGKEACMILLYFIIILCHYRDVGAAMYEQFTGTKEKAKRLDICIDCIRLMLQ